MTLVAGVDRFGLVLVVVRGGRDVCEPTGVDGELEGSVPEDAVVEKVVTVLLEMAEFAEADVECRSSELRVLRWSTGICRSVETLKASGLVGASGEGIPGSAEEGLSIRSDEGA